MQHIPEIAIISVVAFCLVSPLCYIGVCTCIRSDKKVTQRRFSVLNQQRRQGMSHESQRYSGDHDMDLERTMPLPPVAHVRRERAASARTYTEGRSRTVDAGHDNVEEEPYRITAPERTLAVTMSESEIHQATIDRLNDYQDYFVRVRSSIRSICESARSVQPPPATPRLMPSAQQIPYSLPAVEPGTEPFIQPRRPRPGDFARLLQAHNEVQHQAHGEAQRPSSSPQPQPFPLIYSLRPQTPHSAPRAAETEEAPESPSLAQRRFAEEVRRAIRPHSPTDQTSRPQVQVNYLEPAGGHLLRRGHPRREAHARSRWAPRQHDEMGNRLQVPPPAYDSARLPNYQRPTREAPPSYSEVTISENLSSWDSRS